MHRIVMAAAALAAALATAGPAAAADGWKVGRVYSRMVCTACHKDVAGRIISPNERTKAEWQAYFAADRHGAGDRADASVKYYASVAYRQRIKDANAAAKKFLDRSDDQMLSDVVAFFVHGAKDSDTPATCQ